MCRTTILTGLLAAAMYFSSLGLRASPISISTVTVGNPNNAADSADGYGAVGYNYNIGTYDVTLTQYTAFLNSVAATDTYGLYNTSLATDLNVAGISRSGSPGSYSYAVIGDGQRPVTYVSWYDAVRFANWLGDRKHRERGLHDYRRQQRGRLRCPRPRSGAPGRAAASGITGTCPTRTNGTRPHTTIRHCRFQ